MEPTELDKILQLHMQTTQLLIAQLTEGFEKIAKAIEASRPEPKPYFVVNPDPKSFDAFARIDARGVVHPSVIEKLRDEAKEPNPEGWPKFPHFDKPRKTAEIVNRVWQHAQKDRE